MDAGLFRQILILPVKFRIFPARDRVLRITCGARVLVHDARFLMFLSCQMLELGDACKGILIWIINHRYRLMLREVQGFMFKLQTTVGQWAKAELKKFVDRSAVDE